MPCPSLYCRFYHGAEGSALEPPVTSDADKPLTFKRGDEPLRGNGLRVVELLIELTKLNPSSSMNEEKQNKLAKRAWRLVCGKKGEVELHVSY